MKIITLLLLLSSLPVLADIPAGFNGDIAIMDFTNRRCKEPSTYAGLMTLLM